ncbi:MAG: 3-dehydroquinate synthase [Clostridiales bacterium]|nr:3-dehydroquinate synthase [Clostridiales bacterium]
METIQLKTQTTTGTIFVGDEAITARLPQLLQGQKNFVITDTNVYELYPDFFKRYFDGVEIFVLSAGEENKNFFSLQSILEAMSRAGLLRTSRLFAVGGGVVGDIGGLAAALYMRGISCVQIPTTLLAQVDSSVGGKTAVDLGGVKNLVGAFYQPCEVLVAPSFLQTLPMREVKCGIGEIVKYAALDKEIFDMLTKQNDYTETSFLQGLIEKCIRYKVKVVEMDEKESGERRSLNVGHTTGHAIELSTGLSHGESVLYGMFFETQAAITYGVCDKEYGESLLAIVKKALAILPTSTPDFSNVKQYAEKAKTDKKNDSNDKVNMSVAKSKGVWTTFTLPFDSYVTALETAVKSL